MPTTQSQSLHSMGKGADAFFFSNLRNKENISASHHITRKPPLFIMYKYLHQQYKNASDKSICTELNLHSTENQNAKTDFMFERPHDKQKILHSCSSEGIQGTSQN